MTSAVNVLFSIKSLNKILHLFLDVKKTNMILTVLIIVIILIIVINFCYAIKFQNI